MKDTPAAHQADAAAVRGRRRRVRLAEFLRPVLAKYPEETARVKRSTGPIFCRSSFRC